MKFDLVYNDLKKLEGFEFEVYEEDSLTEVLSVVESAFYESGQITFEFECLGEKWLVFVFGDFSVFSEQLLAIFSLCLETNQQGALLLDFYEQGTERKLLLTKTDSRIRVENKSKDTWNSPVEYESIEADELMNNVITFVQKTKQIVDTVQPELNSLETLRAWYGEFEMR